MPAAEPEIVDTGELLGTVVAAFTAHGAGRQVDRPAVQGGPAFARPAPVAVEHPRIAHHVEHQHLVAAAVFGVRVQRVVDVAGLDVEPTHVFVAAFAGHDADTGRVAR